MSNLIYSDDNVFNQENTQTIVNTINCVGVMGAGIALEYKLRFPEMFEYYVKRCRKHEVKIGIPYLYTHENISILNFPTKKHWRDGSELEWIELGLKYFKAHYKEWGITSIAFPKLGTEHGGLNWEDVNKLMVRYLDNLDISVVICLDKLDYPKGIEKDMTNYINRLDEDCLIKIGMAKPIIPTIIDNLPLKRFRYLRELKGIGKISYERLYLFIYHQIINNQFTPQIQTKKLIESKESWSISEPSLSPFYSGDAPTSQNLINKSSFTINKELLNQFKDNIMSFLKLRDEINNKEEKLKNYGLNLVKNYLLQKHPEINWNRYSIKGLDIIEKSNNKTVTVAKLIFDVTIKKNDFEKTQKKSIKNSLKKLETSNNPYKYLFVADESVLNILQAKYKREYPHVEFINILNPELKSSQQKLTKPDFENSTSVVSFAKHT